MAQQLYPISLKDPYYPMLSELQGRTVIGATVGKAPSQDERPTIAYCHNIIPIKEGYNSVAYLEVVPAVTAEYTSPLSDVRIVYGSNSTKLYLMWDVRGKVFVLNDAYTEWLTVPETIPTTENALFDIERLTIGTVNGVSYIYYRDIGAFIYNEDTGVLDNVTLTGIDVSAVLGIIDSAGYLVAYTSEAIAWSSTIDPTDFVPSAVTGAGGGNVAGLAGSILFVVANSLGLLIYTQANTVAGTFTGNVQFPWKFRPVPGASGGLALDLVAYEATSSDQYVYSKAGLQAINSSRAEIIFPEVTDFLAGRRFEDYDEVTKEYTNTDISAGTMKKKVKFIASRYLIISYGVTEFTHAIIVDIALQRLGKLKYTHTDVFEYTANQTEIAKESIALLSADGTIKVVDFSYTSDSSGVLILGKLQASYTRYITLLGVEIENTDPVVTSTLTALSQASLDGKNFTNVEGELKYRDEEVREYTFRNTAKNHSLVFIGKINAVTVLVRYTVAGRR